MALSNKRRVFVDEYLKCWNATEAARLAGYKHPNKQGPRLLVNVGIQDEIKRRLDEKAMSADEVLTRLADMARASIEGFLKFPQKGRKPALDLKQAQESGLLHLVKKLKYNTRGQIEVELHDAQAALQLIGRHHNLFKDQIQTLNVDLSQLSNEQLKRIADGEDPVHVLATSGQGGTGTPPATT